MTPALKPAERQALQTRLQQRREQLATQQRAHLDGQTRAEHARVVLLQDADDAAQRDADREVDLAMTDRDVVELQAVDAALRRLALGRTGGYGDCAECGKAIPLARLQLQPQSLLCVACAARQEPAAPRTDAL